MKAKNLFFGALTCLAFAACSNDDEPVVNPGGGAEGQENFVMVNIAVPNQTRVAASDFQDGTNDENAVTSALFVFFDEDGNYHSAQTPTLAWDGDNDLNPALEKIAEAVVVFKNTTDIPNSVVAILNSTLTKSELDASKPSLSVLKGTGYIADYSASTSGNFVMTSSVYKETDDATSVICESIITTDNIAKKAAGDQEPTAEEKLKAKPVQIYVERVLAKVNITTQGTITNNGTIVDIKGVAADGTITTSKDDFKIIPAIKGYHLAYTNSKSNLLKVVETGASTTWSYGESWTDPNNKRSYWGVSYAPANTSEWGFNKYSESTNSTYYCLENTTDLTNSTTATKLVVTAELQDINGDPIGDLVKHNGWYYMEEDFLKLAAQALVSGGFTYTTEVGSVVTESSDWLTFLKTQRYTGANPEQWLIEVALKTTANYDTWTAISKNDVPYADVATGKSEINTYLQTTVGSAQEWQDSKCYYFVNIKHINNKAAIIRNHIYNLNITSIVGLGTPVYDPDTNEDNIPEEEEIIPDNPSDDASFVMAQVNILKWRIVATQNVELGQ